MKIPKQGRSREEVFDRLEAFRQHDMPIRDGSTWAYVYDPGRDVEEVIKKAYAMYLSENSLDPTVFPSGMHLENEVLEMAREHLHGDEEVVGNFTSGGTESIMLAVKAARDRARHLRPEIKEPEMVLPSTAHAAFQKSAHYLGVKVVIVDVDRETFKADPEKVRAAITDNTIMLVGSAVSYAHCVVDPIAELGQIALEKDLWLHVDGCMGAFLLPYFERLGAKVTPFDFRVPGVTSISMDLHKYAFAAKGASTVLYRSKDYRRYQLYACANWTGYTVVNTTVQSTKTMGPLAAAWAVLNYVGDEGYLKIAKTVLDATNRVKQAIAELDELELVGDAEMNLVAFTSKTVSVFHIIDEMKERGWYIQPQLAGWGSPANIHLSIMPNNAPHVERMLADLKDAVTAAKPLPSGKLAELVKAAFGGLEDAERLSAEQFQRLLEIAGVNGAELPGRMAEINEILNSLPVRVRESLLIEYLNVLFQYHPETAFRYEPGARRPKAERHLGDVNGASSGANGHSHVPTTQLDHSGLGDKVWREWAHMTGPQIDAIDRSKAAVVVACSPLEVHGPHLPTITDNLEADGIGMRAMQMLKAKHPELELLRLPPLYVAADVLPHPGSVMFRSSTITRTMIDLGRSLTKQGFKRLWVTSFHGGPRHFVPIEYAASEVNKRYGGEMVSVFSLMINRLTKGSSDLSQVLAERVGLTETDLHEDAHAGCVETSLMLYLLGEHVDPAFKQLDRITPNSKLEAEGKRPLPVGSNPGITELLRGFAIKLKYYESETYAGKPSIASSELGKRILDVLAEEGAAALSEVYSGKLPVDQCHSPVWPLRHVFLHEQLGWTFEKAVSYKQRVF